MKFLGVALAALLACGDAPGGALAACLDYICDLDYEADFGGYWECTYSCWPDGSEVTFTWVGEACPRQVCQEDM